jgi:AcrR family transcriptional regulator
MPIKRAAKQPKRVRYHHGDLRRDLLRVARAEISRDGADTVTLTSLARLVGVTQAAPYRHFADRETLLEAVAAEGFDEFAAALDDAEAAKPAPRDGLLAIALAYVTFGEANIELYRLMFASRLVPEAKSGSALERAADAAFERLRKAVSAVSAGRAVRDDALLIWAQLHGLVMLRADGLIHRKLSQFVKRSTLVLRRAAN